MRMLGKMRFQLTSSSLYSVMKESREKKKEKKKNHGSRQEKKNVEDMEKRKKKPIEVSHFRENITSKVASVCGRAH